MAEVIKGMAEEQPGSRKAVQEEVPGKASRTGYSCGSDNMEIRKAERLATRKMKQLGYSMKHYEKIKLEAKASNLTVNKYRLLKGWR